MDVNAITRKIALIAGLVLIVQFGHLKGLKKRWRDYVSHLLHIDSYVIC